MMLCSFSEYLVKLTVCFDIVNITFWILHGVFDHALFQIGHLLQKLQFEKPKFGYIKNLGFRFLVVIVTALVLCFWKIR